MTHFRNARFSDAIAFGWIITATAYKYVWRLKSFSCQPSAVISTPDANRKCSAALRRRVGRHKRGETFHFSAAVQQFGVIDEQTLSWRASNDLEYLIGQLLADPRDSSHAARSLTMSEKRGGKSQAPINVNKRVLVNDLLANCASRWRPFFPFFKYHVLTVSVPVIRFFTEIKTKSRHVGLLLC